MLVAIVVVVGGRGRGEERAELTEEDYGDGD